MQNQNHATGYTHMASGVDTHTHTHTHKHTHTYFDGMKVISRNQACAGQRRACAWFNNL